MYSDEFMRELHEVVGRTMERAEELNAPVTIAVVDGGGHLLCFLRHARAKLISCTTATGKARCAVLFSRDSEKTVEVARDNPLTFETFAIASDMSFVIARGGYYLEGGGVQWGAGVAGASAELDEQVGTFLREGMASLLTRWVHVERTDKTNS